MHIGFRYHIASLVAIFFSLFIGILVGSILFQDDLLIQEQDSIIGDLEGKFHQLELRTVELQTNLKLAQTKEKMIQDAWDQVRAFFVGNQLESVEIALVNIDESDLQNRLTDLLKQSGATIIEASFEENTEFFVEVEPEKRKVMLYWNYGATKESDVSLLREIAEFGWQVCILQPYDGAEIDPNLPSSALVIEFADTLVGELALIQGLAQDLTRGTN